MMPQSINKKKIYFYLLILIFLSTTFNFSIISKLNNLNQITNINIEGLSEKEKNNIKNELNVFMNQSIFFIDKNSIMNSLDIFNFIENFLIQKVLPSKLIISAKKTKFLGLTILNGEKFYIGANGRLTSVSQVENENNLPIVFGNFSINDFLNLQNVFENSKIDSKNIKKYLYHKSKRWDLIDQNNITIMLPSKNIETALKNYKTLIENKKTNLVNIIDLRIYDKIILTFNEE